MVASGASVTFDVQYSPVNGFADFETVTIGSDDGNDPFIEVELEGFGVYPADTNKCYASTGNNDGGRLLTIDMATGAATLVGNIDPNPGNAIPALAIDSKGRIIVYDSTYVSFYLVDAVTAEAYTLFGGDSPFKAIIFDENDVLYATKQYGGSQFGLYTVDLNTGTETLIGRYGG